LHPGIRRHRCDDRPEELGLPVRVEQLVDLAEHLVLLGVKVRQQVVAQGHGDRRQCGEGLVVLAALGGHDRGAQLVDAQLLVAVLVGEVVRHRPARSGDGGEHDAVLDLGVVAQLRVEGTETVREGVEVGSRETVGQIRQRPRLVTERFVHVVPGLERPRHPARCISVHRLGLLVDQRPVSAPAPAGAASHSPGGDADTPERRAAGCLSRHDARLLEPGAQRSIGSAEGWNR
jgi:hypothetical protein